MAAKKKTPGKRGGPIGAGSGFYDELMKLLNKKPTKLFTASELEPIYPDKGYAALGSALYYLWRKGDLMRHKAKDEDSREFRYAVEIEGEDGVVWTPMIASAANASNGVQQVRNTFSSIMNQLSQLEDMLVEQLEGSNEAEAELRAIKSKLGKLGITIEV